MLCCISQIYGQDPYFITYDVDNGLPSSEVYDIVSDEKQNIWISTDRGLVKYDGASFKSYNSSDGLSADANFYFNKDGEGNIWISGYNKSLSYIRNDSIIQFNQNKKINQLLGNKSSQWIKYIVNNADTVSFIPFQNYAGIEYCQFSNQISNGKDSKGLAEKIFTDFSLKDTMVYIQGDFYNFYFHQKALTLSDWYRVSKAISLPENQIVYHNRKTIFKKNLTSRIVEKAEIPFDIEKIYFDSENNLWVCTRKGLFYFEDAKLNASPKVYFKDLLISSIVEDFQGNYWVATNDSGVKFIPSFDISNLNYGNNGNENESFLSTFVDNEKIVFGSSKSNLIVCDREEDCQLFSVPTFSSNSQVNNIGQWDKESLMLTRGLLFEGYTFEKAESPIPDHKISSYCKKLENNDWIVFTRNSRFSVLSTKKKILINSDDFIKPIVSNLYTCIQEKKGDIYLGTGNGLFLVQNYDYDNNVEILDNDGNGLGRISSITIDSNNIVWLSTIGNRIYAVIDNKAIKFVEMAKLLNPMVNKIITTYDSTLWLATNNGIDVMSYTFEDTLNLNFIRNINISDGLVSNSVNDLAFWDGKIWAATNGGICNFKTSIMNKHVPQIPISITEFVNKDSTYNIDEELRFDSDQNDVFISYSGLSFQQFGEPVEYKYRLIKDGEGDENWYYTNVRSERFNDLSHGKYTFEVNAMNKLRVWNETAARVNFVIEPRFVDTFLFKLLMVFLFVTGIAAIIKSINDRNAIKQSRLLELQEAKRKTQEAEIAAIRNQMNPHFVYNSLNSIQNLIFKDDSFGANYYLSKFSTLIRQSLQFASVNYISLQQEFDFLSNYLELEKLRFPDKFEYSFKIDDQLDASSIMIPSLILQPIVENSIKHGFDNLDYVGSIVIKATRKENILEVTIKDNGNGIKKMPNNNVNVNNHKSLGIEMVNNRIDLLNRTYFDVEATVKVDRSESGYQTLFVLPIIHNND